MPTSQAPSRAQGQAQRLRQEIDRYRRRLMEIDHPETVRVFEMLLGSAQAQLDQLEDRANSTDACYRTFGEWEHKTHDLEPKSGPRAGDGNCTG